MVVSMRNKQRLLEEYANSAERCENIARAVPVLLEAMSLSQGNFDIRTARAMADALNRRYPELRAFARSDKDYSGNTFYCVSFRTNAGSSQVQSVETRYGKHSTHRENMREALEHLSGADEWARGYREKARELDGRYDEAGRLVDALQKFSDIIE